MSKIALSHTAGIDSSAVDVPATALVVMGVSGSGKSTVASMLGEQFGWQFIEGDAFHSAENHAKMRAGIALTDADRSAWLEILGRQLSLNVAQGAVLSCSALKLRYRNQLRRHVPALGFVWLDISREAARARVAGRGARHFFPANLIDSQFQALEPPSDESGLLRIDAEKSLTEILETATLWLRTRHYGPS